MLLEIERDKAITDKVILIQKVVRGFKDRYVLKTRCQSVYSLLERLTQALCECVLVSISESIDPDTFYRTVQFCHCDRLILDLLPLDQPS